LLETSSTATNAPTRNVVTTSHALGCSTRPQVGHTDGLLSSLSLSSRSSPRCVRDTQSSQTNADAVHAKRRTSSPVAASRRSSSNRNGQPNDDVAASAAATSEPAGKQNRPCCGRFGGVLENGASLGNETAKFDETGSSLTTEETSTFLSLIHFVLRSGRPEIQSARMRFATLRMQRASSCNECSPFISSGSRR